MVEMEQPRTSSTLPSASWMESASYYGRNLRHYERKGRALVPVPRLQVKWRFPARGVQLVPDDVAHAQGTSAPFHFFPVGWQYAS